MFGYENRNKPLDPDEEYLPDAALGAESAEGAEIPESPGESEPRDKKELLEGRLNEDGEPAPDNPAHKREEAKRRHSILMESLEEEGERQAQERQQAQIDDDYYHHLQWTKEHAQELADRGQAPLVYNEARLSIEWLTGTERRLRKDYKVRPREKGDAAIAEVKTNLIKYTEDANRAPWHRSTAFKQAITSGLGWLEEGINTDPDEEMIFAGSEDWRRVLRDSRGKDFDQKDWRYTHRKKSIDLDFACAMFPWAADMLKSASHRGESMSGMDDDSDDGIWYLGEQLTAAHLESFRHNTTGIMGGDWTVRNDGSVWDRGRRQSVDLIETFYRVPEAVQVFGAGPQRGKVFNPADPGHVQLKQDRHAMYGTVKKRMRAMLGTMYDPVWDGPSPFRHGRFLLVPVWAYRRGRDGATYGVMRGMRDPQDDLNKRRSKALFLLSNNRMTMEEGAADDVEEVRAEANRADGIVIVKNGKLGAVRFDKNMGEVQGNMELAAEDVQHIRNAGGVTGENLGQRTNAASGKAIIAKQEQGSMVTFELFDNLLLAFKMSGELRLSHIEQFCNQEWQVRIDPMGKAPMWVSANQRDPRTGQIMNDITASTADFVVDQQDYRATLTQYAMEAMFELLGQLATFSPQVVLSLLDLAVEAQDIPGKDEWVARIRKINGQRDPTKEPTPEEQAADAKAMAKQQYMEGLNMETLEAQLDEIKAKVNNTNADKVLKKLQSLLASVEAAAMAVTMSGLAPAADVLAQSAGYEDETPVNPIFALPSVASALPQQQGMQPGMPMGQQPMPMLPAPQAGGGMPEPQQQPPTM